jgi:predicted CXXCH cytochrome family protein
MTLLSVSAVGVCGALAGCSDEPEPGTVATGTSYVGRAACAECHSEEAALWAGSHHDLAMQEATDASVLADFGGEAFTHRGVTTRFYRDGERFMVETDGPDGAIASFPVTHTFGVAPLQQYLVELPGGRLQAHTVAWDTRPADAGGQRWFHIYPDEETPPGDVLHWAGAAQSWNYMCAECHSTDLQKGYDLASDSYDTRWAEIDVSCEACHGPGSEHVAWAQENPDGVPESSPASGARDDGGRFGLMVELGDPAGGSWVMDPTTGIAARSAPSSGTRQIDACGKCHSRRASLLPETPPGGALMDTHLPRTLADGLYFADGQILDEVYVWGSFLQSAMYRAGVLCSDCHDPHSASLKAPGNGVCAACHAPDRFDVPEHHFHEAESEAAQCVSCHAPARSYMVVDPRRDHSFRVPRPDLSEALESPDACVGCHDERTSAWATATVVRWYGPERRAESHYGEALQEGREGGAGAEVALMALVVDTVAPAIVRATAVELMTARPGPALGAVIPNALRDPDPLVRWAGVRALEAIPPNDRVQPLTPLLTDPEFAVRAEAARVLAPVARAALPPGLTRILDRATAEYVESLQASLDHPSAHVNLARLRADQGRTTDAEASLSLALRIGPWFVPAWVNLADLYRSQGREVEAEALLREGIDAVSEAASLHYALGLLLVRTGRALEALTELETAAALEPLDPRFAYTLGVALNSERQSERALEVLASAVARHPNDRDILFALATMHRDAGAPADGLRYARRLAELEPGDRSIADLVAQLEAAR